MNLKSLVKGKVYKVNKEFIDYDGNIHIIGKIFVFDKTEFSPNNSGVSLFIIENSKPVMYRFVWEDEGQGELLDEFMNYVEEIYSS